MPSAHCARLATRLRPRLGLGLGPLTNPNPNQALLQLTPEGYMPPSRAAEEDEDEDEDLRRAQELSRIVLLVLLVL